MACLRNIVFQVNLKVTFKILAQPECIQRFYSQKRKQSLDGPVDLEVDFHSQLAERWWKSEALIGLNEIRVPFIREGICISGLVKTTQPRTQVNILEGCSILDVGCGGGILSEALARIGGDVYGIDPSSALIDVAVNHAKSDRRLLNKLRYEVANIHNYCQKHAEQFDAVVISEVIEHIQDKEKFLNSCIQCLKPRGAIFLTTPNKTWLARFFLIRLAESLNILPIGTHDFDKFITPEELSSLIKNLGCTVRHIEGICYNPITGKFWSSGIRFFMYAMFAQKVVSKDIQYLRSDGIRYRAI